MKPVLRWTAISLGIIFLTLQFVRPAKTNPAIDESRALQKQTELPADVEAVLKRACYDCHSNETDWPWYSQVAPVSWFVADHVNQGRRHLNFSDWAGYSKQDRITKLYLIGETVGLEMMPLKSYLILHSEARLTDDEKKLIKEWAQAEQKKLNR